MADIKISELPVADQANIDDLLEASQVSGPGYVSRHISLDQVATVVADSTQITDLVDDAIGEIPPLTWDNIVDKPATFPPTVPIAWADISGEPSTYPPSAHSHLAADLPAPPTTLPPNGAAGGDLAGSYPNPLIKPGTNTHILTTVAGVAAWAAPPSSAPSGSAGGDLAGTYPNPTIKADVALSGNPTTTTQTAGNNTTRIATTAFVTAALAGGGASISVGTTPPVSPAANALWWNSDAAIGGGQMFIYYDSFWVPASPGVGTGSVVQTQSFQTGAVATGTTLTPFDNTIPQITEGTEFLTCAITPKSATSKLVITVQMQLCGSTALNIAYALHRDAVANALNVNAINASANGVLMPVALQHTMTSGTISATTFRVRVGPGSAGTVTMNGGFSGPGTAVFGGVMASSIVIQEVL